MIVSGIANVATNFEIGAAELYRAAVIFSHNPGGNAAPAWLANLEANVHQIAADVHEVSIYRWFAFSWLRSDHHRLQIAANVNEVTGRADRW